jgi:hypothetical protein
MRRLLFAEIPFMPFVFSIKSKSLRLTPSYRNIKKTIQSQTASFIRYITLHVSTSEYFQIVSNHLQNLTESLLEDYETNLSYLP